MYSVELAAHLTIFDYEKLFVVFLWSHPCSPG